MALFKPAKITKDGQLMLMQDLKGEVDIQFTRIAFGDGDYTEDEYRSITSRTKIKAEKQSAEINTTQILDESTLILSVIISNEHLGVGYKIKEIGVYAKNSKDLSSPERLYAIIIAEENCADYIPAYNGTSPVYIRQNVQVDVLDASQTTIAVSDSVVVTKDYLESVIDVRHPKSKHHYLGRSIYEATFERNAVVNSQNQVGRLYISGTNAIEYVDLESTANAEVISENEPENICFIQTWHTYNGEIKRRFKIGKNNEWSDWTTISTTMS